MGWTPKTCIKPFGVSMGRRRTQEDLMAEVSLNGRNASTCPGFKERIQWAFM